MYFHYNKSDVREDFTAFDLCTSFYTVFNSSDVCVVNDTSGVYLLTEAAVGKL